MTVVSIRYHKPYFVKENLALLSTVELNIVFGIIISVEDHHVTAFIFTPDEW